MRIPIPLFIAVFLVALPVILPLACILHLIYRHRLMIAGKSEVCPECGQILGVESVQKADESWKAHVADIRRVHPGTRFRWIRWVHSICTVCGSRLQFQEKTGTFSKTATNAH